MVKSKKRKSPRCWLVLKLKPPLKPHLNKRKSPKRKSPRKKRKSKKRKSKKRKSKKKKV